MFHNFKQHRRIESRERDTRTLLGLGTPQEDICSMAAAYQTNVEKHFLLSVGFGIDHFHGVSHYRFLENVTEIMKSGGYLGMFQMTKEMKEVTKYIDAVNFANKRMIGKESIVSNSIVSALEGEYGDFHKTLRTKGSQLWINPLMTIFWVFDLRKVIPKIKYYDFIKSGITIGDFNRQLSRYRNSLKILRKKRNLPI